MNRTKNMISYAFIQLLEEKSISKITVKDIADRCEINRNTFYYHFQDIPQLCEYICKQNIDALLKKHCRPNSPMEMIAAASDFFTQRSNIMLHIYHSLPRETFLRDLTQLALYLVQGYMDATAANSPIPEGKRALLTRYYKCVLVGTLLDWLDSGMSYDLAEMASLICEMRAQSDQHRPLLPEATV